MSIVHLVFRPSYLLYIRNYDHIASLWQHEQWLPEAAVQLARSHYAGYMVKRLDGLRVISLNTNLCKSKLMDYLSILSYLLIARVSVCKAAGSQHKIDEFSESRANYFNYINMTNPDTSGMLRFLTDQLQDAEDAGDRGALIP